MYFFNAGIMNNSYQGFALSFMFPWININGGSLFYHNPAMPLPPNDYLTTQNNFTPSDLINNDGGNVLKYPIWCKAISIDDMNAGRICVVTGYWAPGHAITYVDGRPMLSHIARLPESGRIARNINPESWYI